jgi:hypothetical protein
MLKHAFLIIRRFAQFTAVSGMLLWKNSGLEQQNLFRNVISEQAIVFSEESQVI